MAGKIGKDALGKLQRILGREVGADDDDVLRPCWPVRRWDWLLAVWVMAA